MWNYQIPRAKLLKIFNRNTFLVENIVFLPRNSHINNENKMKKLFTLATLLAIAVAMSAQIKFTVKGVATEKTKQVTWLNTLAVHSQLSESAQTADVVDGKFTLSGEGQQGDIYAVIDVENRMQSFFVCDSEEITVDMNTDISTGGELNSRLTEAMQAIVKAEQSGDNSECLQLIEKNKDNNVAALILSNIQYSLKYDQLKTLLESGSPYLKHPFVKGAERMLKSLETRRPGLMFKDLEENDVDGKPHKLSEYLGKGNYVLVDFWASWCGPCMAEMPNVKANYEKYHPKGFEVVGLSFDRNGDAWKKCIADNGLNWIHLSDLKFWQSIAATTYGIQSIPASILFDPEGKIVDCDLRGPRLGQTLAEIYGE